MYLLSLLWRGAHGINYCHRKQTLLPKFKSWLRLFTFHIGDITTLNAGSLKLVDKFTYFRSSISSTEKDINMQLMKAWTAIDRLSIMWKSNLSDKIKCNFFQAVLLYGCTTWMLTKRRGKKLDRNCIRMLWAILNKFWKQHPIKQQLYSHLPPISKTKCDKQDMGHYWRSKDELISNILLWTPSHGYARVRWPTRT